MSEPTLSAQQSTNTSSASSTPGASSSSSTSPSYYSTSSSATSHSSTPTPTVHSLAPTPAPSRNPSLFPGAENSPAALGLGLVGGGGAAAGAAGSNGRTHLTAAQPGRHFANNADYINALAAAAQASLQSAPSSPGADLPIARSSAKRSSIYGAGGLNGGGVGGSAGMQDQQQQSLPERLNEMLVDEERDGEAENGGGEENGESEDRATELPPLTTSMDPPHAQHRQQQPPFDPARGSFLDVDSITPVTTPGSVDHQGILWAGGARGGPVNGAAGVRAVDEMEVEEEEEEEYEGFVDPFARARAGVSVAKGEGLVQQAGVMMNGHQHQQGSPQEGALNGGSGQEHDGTSDRQ